MLHCARNASLAPRVPFQFLHCPAYHAGCYSECLNLVLKGHLSSQLSRQAVSITL